MIFQKGCQPLAFSCVTNESILRHLHDRETQILAVEAFAAIAAPWILPHVFQGADVVWWIDNNSACSTLIRGAAKPEDIDKFAAIAAIQFATLRGRPWYEWVDTEANPADGLSRLGIFDPWTMQQGWCLHDLGDYCWDAVFDAYNVWSA